jgi:hypothetical protein
VVFPGGVVILAALRWLASRLLSFGLWVDSQLTICL